ncbi:glycosyltransferase [candidate division KSB1 bacterium]|nr:glycosyltransferase [candidate division KSB1 bacterium]
MANTTKNHLPGISVMIPVRNEEKYIGQCISSLLLQEYDPVKIEILVVDGDSTDRTTEIVTRFGKKNPRIQLLHNPERTVPHALNIALDQAKGGIMIRVDGHASVHPDYLKKCVYYLEKTGADCVGGIIESINSSYTGKAIALAMSSTFGVGNARFRTSGREGYVDTVAFGAYPATIFKTIGHFDEELVRCQDDEFNYRLRKSGGKIFFTPEIKARYYPRSGLFALAKQYFQYGLYKVRVLQKHFRMMQIRQFVPALFVLALFMTAVAGLVVPLMHTLLKIILFAYLSACLLFTLNIARQDGIKYAILLFVIFPILHISYGAGFILGQFKFIKYYSM